MSSSTAEALSRFQAQVEVFDSPAGQLNDFVYLNWYKYNWGDLLQPAPMAVLILANLSLVASTTDFKLVEPADGFTHVKYPESFRATVVQLVDTGAIALEKSYRNFDEIQKRCAGVVPAVNTIINLLAGSYATSEQEMNNDIRRHLPREVSRLQGAVQACFSKAQETEAVFEALLNLTMEVNASCTATRGATEAKLADATMRQKILAAQKDAMLKSEKIAEEQLKLNREAVENAQKQFTQAADDIPSGWEMIGMQFVEGLSQAVVQTFRAAADLITLASRGRSASENGAINTAAGEATVAGPAIVQPDLCDPSYQVAHTILICANSLHALTENGPNGGINWEGVTAQNDSGAAWLRNVMRTALDRKWGPGEASTTAKTLLESGIKLAAALQDIAPTRPEKRVADLVSEIKKFTLNASQFFTSVASKSGVSALQAPGFAAPSQPPKPTSGSAAEMAVKSGQLKLEVAQKQLEAAQKMSNAATDKLLSVQAQLGDVLGQVASLDFQKIDWMKIRSILLRAIAFLCQLKGCLADLVHFFGSINNLVGITMNETVSNFIQLIGDTTATHPNSTISADRVVSGVSLSNWTRQAIYQQALDSAKVARLVEKIATIYLKMYDGHVHDGVKKVLVMGQHIGDSDAERALLHGAVREIDAWAGGASEGITRLIRDEQDKMQDDIENRLQQLRTSFAGILPPAPTAVRIVVEETTRAHVEEVRTAQHVEAINKPVFKPRLGMTI